MLTLPMIMPFIYTAMAIRSLDLARAYDVVRIMTNGGPGNRTELIWTYVNSLAFQRQNYALGSAMSYVTVVISFLFTWYLFRNVMKSRFDMREISALYTFPAWKRLFRVRYMNLPDFVRWDPAEINSQLENEFGIHRTLGDSRRDCLAGPVSDRIFRLRTGFGKHEYLYANLVRAGFLDRAEALDQLRRRGNELGEADVENLLALIGCDVSVLEGIREKNSRNFAGRAGFTRRLAARLRVILP
jgi:hypothetical protein